MNIKIIKARRESATEVAEPKKVKLSATSLQQEAVDAEVVQAVENLAARSGIAMPAAEQRKPEQKAAQAPKTQAPESAMPQTASAPQRKKRTKAAAKPADAPTPAPKQTEETGRKLFLFDYSEKAVAVFGDTRPIKDKLKAIGGRFNPNLRPFGPDSSMPGWIFPASKREELQKLVSA